MKKRREILLKKHMKRKSEEVKKRTDRGRKGRKKNQRET